MPADHRHLLLQRQEMIMNGNHRFSSGKQITARRVSIKWAWIMAVAADMGVYIRRVSERCRQRRALALLDRRLLNDIGLSAETAQEELRRPFWR